ncbi:hypothetical protein D3O62_19395, partial [Vibrio cholerae]|nr:hypothetical protein [Vibrio cholerae]
CLYCAVSVWFGVKYPPRPPPRRGRGKIDAREGRGSKAVAFNHISLDTLAHIEVNNLYEWFGVQV